MNAASPLPLLHTYIRSIEAAYRTGHATEHTYRSDLKRLIERLSPGIVALNEPKRVACGAPDFVIGHKQTPLGYIGVTTFFPPIFPAKQEEKEVILAAFPKKKCFLMECLHHSEPWENRFVLDNQR